MGDNRGYSIYEHIIVGLYDNDALNKATLDVVLFPFKGTDMDHGGSEDMRSKDDLSADEIVVKIGNPDYWNEYQQRNQAFLDNGILWDDALQDEFDEEWRKLTETW